MITPTFRGCSTINMIASLHQSPAWSKGCVGCGNICAPIKGNCGKGATSCAVAGKASIKSPKDQGPDAT